MEKPRETSCSESNNDVKETADVVEEGRFTFTLMLCTMTVSIGSSMEFGYNLGVISGPYQFIQDFINETYFERSGSQLHDDALTWLWATVVSIYCVGGAIGALAGGYCADYFGRNRGLIYNNFISIVGSVLMGCCQIASSPEMLIVGRFIIGISCGMSLTIVPVYLAEIAPFNLRGAIAVTSQLLITTGILVAQVLGFYAFYDETTWPAVFGLSAATGLMEFLVLPFCPESPRWLLIKQHDKDGAIDALQRLRGLGDVHAEINEMNIEHQHESESEKVGVLDVLSLRDKTWKMPLIICIVLHAGMQFSGLNAIIFYSTEIYLSAGMTDAQVAYATVGFGSVFVLSTVASILAVERLGRRTLLLYPFFIQSLWLAGLTVSLALQEQHNWTTWLSLAFVYLYIITFGIGPAPVPYVLSTELWSQGPRPAAVSISVQVNWWANFIVQLSFPSIQAAIGQYVFLIYMAFSLLTTVFIFFYVPETKNQSFDDIVSQFRVQSNVKDITEDILQRGGVELHSYENKGQ